MPKKSDFKKNTLVRLKTVKILIKGEDWDAAAYMMGYTLECALKAATCKTLNLEKYPDKTGADKVDNFFKTHNFDRLLVVSGLTDLFSFNQAAFNDWSNFTKDFPGEWTEMRYNAPGKWDQVKVLSVYNSLESIIRIIKKGRRW